MTMDVDFTIASGGTVSGAAVIPGGYRLQSLNVPTIDSATLAISLSDDNSTFRTPYDASGSLGQVQGASVGGRVVVLSEILSRATEGRAVKITAGAAQTSGAVTIKGRCVRVEA